MKEAIEQFHTQFSFMPEIVNGEKMSAHSRFVVGGMGGSGHAADLLHGGRPDIDLHVHRDYGIPELPDGRDREHLFVTSSYSGNTEEAIDFLHTAQQKKLPVCVYTKGGMLLDIARKENLPHIVLPNTGVQPRNALGFSILALAKIIGRTDIYKELQSLREILKPSQCREQGKKLAGLLFRSVPVIYTSARNRSISNNWKIKLNETGKTPAYCDVFPELNHNEIEGYSNAKKGKTPTKHFYFIFITDEEDHPKVQKRMELTRGLYEEQGLKTFVVPSEGKGRFERMFNSLLLADWTAFYLAEMYGLDSEEVPMVEDLKKML